jgi:hypothetical protein
MEDEKAVEVALPLPATGLPRYRRCLPLIYLHMIFFHALELFSFSK